MLLFLKTPFSKILCSKLISLQYYNSQFINKYLSVYLANKTLDLLSVEGVWWGTHPKEATEEKTLVTKH